MIKINKNRISDEVEEFIKRRFPINCNWLTGNCFYFGAILLSRFPKGRLWYDVIYGHFVFQLNDNFYDWTGIINPLGKLIPWDEFEKYDKAQYMIIMRDCIK